jgi:hypothetical protein
MTPICECPHCHAELSEKEALRIYGKLASVMIRRKLPKTSEEIRARRYKLLQSRAKKPKAPGTWHFEVWEHDLKIGSYTSKDLKIGSYTSKEDCIEEAQRLRKIFPDFKFVIHGPDGSVWIPKKADTPSGIRFERLKIPAAQ